jgi:Cu2+-exporting ATPase
MSGSSVLVAANALLLKRLRLPAPRASQAPVADTSAETPVQSAPDQSAGSQSLPKA